MEHLASELAQLAWQLQRDAQDLRVWANEANRSAKSDESIESALVRIEGRLGSIHDHTTELMDRVPSDLGHVLSDLKSALLGRLDKLTMANRSLESASGCRSGVENQANDSAQSAVSAAKLLTPQERRVFQLCLQSGFLSYQDIASHLDITPTAAKNLVNRVFLSDRKRPLFAKEYKHGAVRVGVNAAVRGPGFPAGGERREPSKRTFVLPGAFSEGSHQPATAAAAVAPQAHQAGRRKAIHVL